MDSSKQVAPRVRFACMQDIADGAEAVLELHYNIIQDDFSCEPAWPGLAQHALTGMQGR